MYVIKIKKNSTVSPGNDYIHMLTDGRTRDLYFEVKDTHGSPFFTKYKGFSVGSESKNYKLQFDVSSYTGNAGKKK